MNFIKRIGIAIAKRVIREIYADPAKMQDMVERINKRVDIPHVLEETEARVIRQTLYSLEAILSDVLEVAEKN